MSTWEEGGEVRREHPDSRGQGVWCPAGAGGQKTGSAGAAGAARTGRARCLRPADRTVSTEAGNRAERTASSVCSAAILQLM